MNRELAVVWPENILCGEAGSADSEQVTKPHGYDVGTSPLC